MTKILPLILALLVSAFIPACGGDDNTTPCDDGGAPQCVTDADCPDPGPCLLGYCHEGTCGTTTVHADHPGNCPAGQVCNQALECVAQAQSSGSR